MKRDWVRIVDTLRLLDSPQYLRHNGRPLLAIWGFGFTDRSPTPSQAAELIDFFKNHPDPRYRVTLLGGVPARWRTLTRDSQRDAAWASVYRSFDIISPWTVGRFRDDAGIDRFYADEVAKDLVSAVGARGAATLDSGEPASRRRLHHRAVNGRFLIGLKWCAQHDSNVRPPGS